MRASIVRGCSIADPCLAALEQPEERVNVLLGQPHRGQRRLAIQRLQPVLVALVARSHLGFPLSHQALEIERDTVWVVQPFLSGRRSKPATLSACSLISISASLQLHTLPASRCGKGETATAATGCPQRSLYATAERCFAHTMR